MNHDRMRGSGPRRNGAIAAMLSMVGCAVSAQTASPSGSTASDPNPYYLGVSQALTYDTNVFRSPSGPSDLYSSTSLLGGFDQPIGRQRIFGNAIVTANRYRDQDQLDNESYNVYGGLDWQTINDFSGNFNGGIGRSLAIAPFASGIVPTSSRNIGDTKNASAVARWGGAARLSIEGMIAYSDVEYSAPEYVTSNSSTNLASLGLYYRPGGNVRLGLAGRFTETDSPQAVAVVGGGFQPNTVRGENIDFVVDYDLTGLLTTNARISYSKQKNSGLTNADYSGLTGIVSLLYRPTGKLTFNATVAREPGFNSSIYSGVGITFIDPTTPVLTPVSGLYQNNQITNSLTLNVGYLATAKVTANASLRYAKARLVTTIQTASGSQPAPDTIDILKAAQIGASWAIARNWSLGCNLAYERRDVSGATVYDYTATTVGCAGQYTWR